MPEKKIKGWLVVDWRKGKHRTRQSKPSPSELGTNELVSKLEIDVTVPKVDIPTLAVEIDVPEPQIHAATLEALGEDQLPDWSHAANDHIDANATAFEAAEPYSVEWDTTVNNIVVATLQDAPGRPDVNTVREYVDRVASESYVGEP